MVSWVDEAGRTERRDNIHFCSYMGVILGYTKSFRTIYYQ
jgi:hypothetical protein